MSSWLAHFRVPHRSNWSRGEIRALTTTIYAHGSHTVNGEAILRIGLKGNYRFHHGIVILEEAFEFDLNTYSALIRSN